MSVFCLVEDNKGAKECGTTKRCFLRREESKWSVQKTDINVIVPSAHGTGACCNVFLSMGSLPSKLRYTVAGNPTDATMEGLVPSSPATTGRISATRVISGFKFLKLKNKRVTPVIKSK